MSSVILKPGKEILFSRRHHWIFSGAIASFPEGVENGSLLPVYSHAGKKLGHAYFNQKSSLIGRIVSFGEKPPLEAISEQIANAILLRKQLFQDQKTTAYRLINGEGDLLPGLIVDRYQDFLVMQIGTLGMEKLKGFICETLQNLLPIKGIYEKSLLSTRKEEMLAPHEEQLWGEEWQEVTIQEEGLCFIVSRKGQKTGFFLDQREMRALIRSLAKGKRVLNCFAYTGGFTVAALAGGAIGADSVDISESALQIAQKNVALNGFSDQNAFFCEDVLDFVKKRELDYDIVILDPPAFAKKKGDIAAATRGYKAINTETMKKMPPESLLLTCSCSYHISEELFEKILVQSALMAKREVRIVGKHRLGMDHPINLYHPETSYLKSFLLYLT